MNWETRELLPTAVAPSMRTLYGPLPGFDVLLSRLEARLAVADVLADPPPTLLATTAAFAVRCSVLKKSF